MRLENWELLTSADEYESPEQRRLALSGDVYGHPVYPDGRRVYTSRIIGLEGESIVTRSGSRYELGEPHPDYEARYPGARARILVALGGQG